MPILGRILSKRALWFSSAFLMLSQYAFATAHRETGYTRPDEGYCYHCEPTQYFLNLNAGPLFTTAGKTQTFFLQPEIQKTYTADRKRTAKAAGELFLGIDHLFEPGFRGEIGLAAGIARSSLRGDIWEDANGNYDDFTYQYNINSTRYAVKGKFLIEAMYDCAAYFSASAGIGANESNQFRIKPIISPAVPAPRFQANSELSFSYSLGVGIQHELSEHWQVGAGYEFTDWGKSSLSRAPGQSLNNGLGLSQLYTNEIQFSISYMMY